MNASTLFGAVAKAFVVREIADPIKVFIKPNDSIQLALAKGGESYPPEETCIVEDETRIYGYIELTADLESVESTALASDRIIQIRPDQIIPASTSILDALPLFEQKFYYFLLESNRLTYVLSYIHIDKLPTKLALFALFMELEAVILDRVAPEWFRDVEEKDLSDYLKHLSAGRMQKAKELCHQKGKDENPRNLILCTNFADKKVILQKDPELSSLLPFRSKAGSDSFFDKVEKLRNQIAHGDSILGVEKSPAGMIHLVNDVERVIRALVRQDHNRPPELKLVYPTDHGEPG